MARLRRSKLDCSCIPSLLLSVMALALSPGCETGYLIEGFPVCDPFVETESPTSAAAPAAFAQAHFGPNPFIDATQLRINLPRPGKITVEVYDVSGRRVGVLADGDAPAGEFAIPWNAVSGSTRLAAGIYFVRSSFGGETRIEKLTLIR